LQKLKYEVKKAAVSEAQKDTAAEEPLSG